MEESNICNDNLEKLLQNKTVNKIIPHQILEKKTKQMFSTDFMKRKTPEQYRSVTKIDIDLGTYGRKTFHTI